MTEYLIDTRLRHPGVTDRGGRDAGTRLDRASLDNAQAEVLGYRLVRILNDLHDIGIAHGDVRVEHVWLDPNGRPVIDGWSGARVLDGPISRRRSHPQARADDAAVAALLALHGVALTQPRRRRPLARVAVALVAIDLVLGFLLVTRAPGVSSAPPPIALANGVVAFGGHRYAIGVPGDVVRIGRWRCTAVPTAALLRPSTGEVWTFPRWPVWPNALVGGRAAIVRGAVALDARPTGACDTLIAHKADGTIAPVDVQP